MEKVKTDEKHAVDAIKQQSYSIRQPAAISRGLALLIAMACGMAVANVYYAHPLLDTIANEFDIELSSVGIVITVTQGFYALGLLLLVPLGDLMNRRWLIPGQMFLSVIALVTIALAPGIGVLFSGLAVMGLLAVVTQTLVAYAATLAAPSDRGRIIGLVTSGIVIGILLARFTAGVLTDLAGWRSVYLFSAVCLLVLSLTLLRFLPHEQRKVSLTYIQLLQSVFVLYREERILRVRSLFGFLIFTAFSVFWTSLVLPLSTPPLSLSHSVIGAFGLVGVAGALGAVRAGLLADRGLGQQTTGIAIVLLMVSWLPISYTKQSLVALIAGIILLDLAVQAIHVTNQSIIMRIRPEARSRLTAAYMIFYSMGSAFGSIASTNLYAYAGWTAVCWFGAGVSTITLLLWVFTNRPFELDS
ncbi:MFS transporter [Paenibacillus sp. JDR-2]|uniref:MFS transporter n=1 Tax=Paenibacillus sp. (strain JDR-2) TaxID=324057 RepID=UPI000166A284|nr:MFS transporter [Paenibacillus sp. JDR-2]ACT00310.1 major facilitator superfamily MFS_1 [Paenibacillus sp. JDR-2]